MKRAILVWLLAFALADQEAVMTSSDGAIQSNFITYVQMDRDSNQGVVMYPGALPRFSKDYSFTLMMWIKPLTNLEKEAELNSIHEIFKIGEEISCKIVIGPNQLHCGSQ